jgi:ERCC4-type nuclease
MMDRITVVVDTREQEPYSFDSDKVSAVRKALPAGDYSLVGLEERVAVERKSLTDFVSTVIRGRKRFHRELKSSPPTNPPAWLSSATFAIWSMAATAAMPTRMR